MVISHRIAAMAAAVIIIAGLWIGLLNGTTPNGISDIRAVIAILSEPEAAIIQINPDEDHEQRLESLAYELLRYQGLDASESMDEDITV